jgi:hypothetical protein
MCVVPMWSRAVQCKAAFFGLGQQWVQHILYRLATGSLCNQPADTTALHSAPVPAHMIV